jgi:hypothetical protein
LGGVHTRGLDASDYLGQFFLDLGLVRRLVQRECGLHLRQQVLLQELGDLGALGMHDPIEAEVEVRLVELEQFFQLADQLLALVVVGGAHRRRFQA